MFAYLIKTGKYQWNLLNLTSIKCNEIRLVVYELLQPLERKKGILQALVTNTQKWMLVMS